MHLKDKRYPKNGEKIKNNGSARVYVRRIFNFGMPAQTDGHKKNFMSKQYYLGIYSTSHILKLIITLYLTEALMRLKNPFINYCYQLETRQSCACANFKHTSPVG